MMIERVGQAMIEVVTLGGRKHTGLLVDDSRGRLSIQTAGGGVVGVDKSSICSEMQWDAALGFTNPMMG